MTRTPLWLLLVACSGTIGDAGGDPPAPPIVVDPTVPGACDGVVTPSPATTRRLTNEEFVQITSSVLDLDPAAVRALTVPFASDERISGYAANTLTDVGSRQVELYLDAAQQLAALAAARGTAPACADVATRSACAADYLAMTGRRLFRRPLHGDEQAALVSRHDGWAAEQGAAEAGENLLASLLVSPQFFYIAERGTDEVRADGARRLSDHELATRLSMLLWSSGPDDALLSAADAGALATDDGLRAEIERMESDPRAEEGMRAFLLQWLDTEGVRAEPKSEALFPYWNDDVQDSMLREAELVIGELSRGTLADLFTSPLAFADGRLAPLYGVDASGDEFVRVESLPGRTGVLTLPAFLAAHAHAEDPSWVKRGHFIRTQVLCETLPEPPADIDFDSVLQDERVNHEVCGSCHRPMDPIGWAFDDYDATGLLSGTGARAGEVVDLSGRLGDLAGDFASPAELAQKLAESDVVSRCMVRQAYRYAHRRFESASDGCEIEAIHTRFRDDGLTIRGLIRSVALADGFRWVVAEEAR